MVKLTPAACRAGRALVEWTLDDLAEKSGVSRPAIARFETGVAKNMRQGTAEKILRAFDAAGVEIVNGEAPGARLRAAG